ncbi:hypothetical protein CDEF62S_04319 [Castellaniella defragrans]
MALGDLFAHGADFLPQVGGVARQQQDAFADGLEARTDFGVARHEACAGEGLVFPGPGLRHLVMFEGCDGDRQQARVAVGAQPQVDLVQPSRGGQSREPGRHPAPQFRVAFARVLIRVVVQEHQIQVGGVAEFLAAQLAVGNDGEVRLARIAAQGARQDLGPDPADGLGQQQIGQGREVVGQALDADDVFQVLGQQLEGDLMLHVAHEVHLLFDVRLSVRQHAGVQVGAQLLGQCRKVGRLHEAAPFDQAVEQQRVAGQVLRRPGAGAHDAGHTGQGFGVFGEQRQVGAALRDVFHQVEQPLQRLAGCLGTGSLLHEPRHERVDPLLAGERQAVDPVAVQQRIDTRLQVRRLGVRERDLAWRGGHGFRLGGFVSSHAGDAEGVAETIGHAASMVFEFHLEGVRVGEAHGLGERRRLAGRVRQQVRLLVFPVLQPVFEAAQEDVGGFQAVGLRLAQDAGAALLVQGGQQIALLQRRLAPAPDELVELHHEFDFADAAFAQLDVVTGVDAIAGAGPPLPIGADAFAQATQRGEGVEVEIFAVDEGHPQGFDFAALRPEGRFVEERAGDQSGFQPGVALPFAPLGDQVVLEGGQAPGQRPAVAVRAQPQVRAKDVAVGVEFGEQRGHQPADLAVELVVADAAAAVGFAFFLVEHDEVDIR